MMKTAKKCTAILSLMLIIALLVGSMPAAFAEGSFPAVVKSKSMKVYAAQSPYEYLGSLPKGTVVTVEDYSGKAALISYNGKTGMAKVSDMKKASLGDSEEKEETKETVDTSKATPMVTVKATRIYKKASVSSKYTSVKAGTKLNLIAVNGSCAMVEKDGAIGYTYKSHLAEPGAVVEKPEAEDKAESSVITMNVSAVTNKATRVYKKASTSSKYVSVPKGTEMTVTAVNGSCAQVKYNGAVGYTYITHLSEKSADKKEEADTSDKKEETSDDKKEETADKKEEKPSNVSALFNSSYSNEQICFYFLTKVMGYSTAAACGVVGNIKYESGFRPTAGGDGGTSYGIVQWHAGRKTNLINWCKKNNYDYTTLEGQLYYLQYELTQRYTKVHKYLQGVDNTAQGAYDAGYYFCYHFEAPASKASKSVTRGNYCKDTLWPRYS